MRGDVGGRAAELPRGRRRRDVTALEEIDRRTPSEEREFRLLSWRTDVTPGAGAEALLGDDLDAPWEINLEANRTLGADAARHAGDLRAALPTLSVPVLLVHGSNDPRPVRGAEELAELLPRAELVTLPTGHSPWLEAPEDVRESLVQFLVGLG